MLKRLLSVALAGLLINAFAFAPASARAKQDKDARRIEKIRKAVGKLGTGEKARVRVTLKDKTKLAGHVSQMGADDFDVTAKTGTPTRVAYADVKQVEGRNLSTGAKIAIGLGIAAAVIVVVGLIGLHEVRNSCCF